MNLYLEIETKSTSIKSCITPGNTITRRYWVFMKISKTLVPQIKLNERARKTKRREKICLPKKEIQENLVLIQK